MGTLQARHQVLLRIALVVLVLDGAAWMGWEFYRLVWQPEPMGAIDLRLRYDEVQRWFAGAPVYRETVTSVYPPATLAILWPTLGWLSFSAARWFWAVTSIGAGVAAIVALMQGSLAASRLERAFIAALAIGTYPFGATVGNGQLSIHVMACALCSVLWLARHEAGLQRYLVVPLLVFSMAKPSSGIPFLVLALFLPGGLLPVLLSGVVYVGLTFFAAAYQPEDLITLIREVAANTNLLASFTGALFYANLHAWLVQLGLQGLLLPASAAALVLLAAWIYWYRKCDIWLLLGITAIVTRMWTYHRWYDDGLLLIPMVALFRLLKTDPSASSNRVPVLLFSAGLITMLAPGGLYLLPGPWSQVYTAWETLLWVAYLIFLARETARGTIAGGTSLGF